MWSLQPLDTIQPLDMLTAAASFQAKHDRLSIRREEVPAPTVAEAGGLLLRATFGNKYLAAAVARVLACSPSMLIDVANALERGPM